MLDPALRQLLLFQTTAKCRRVCRAFSTRRRSILTVIATVLAIIWFGNLILSVLFRDATTHERFARLVPSCFLVYALWHVIKPAFKRPEEAIEWTSAERELLCAGPFARHHLMFYRLASILNAALAKAACFTLLMLPELRQPIAGFLGALLALSFLDLLRVNVEITTHGLSDRSYRRFRLATSAIVAGVICSTLTIAFAAPNQWSQRSSHLTLAIMRHIIGSASQLLETVPGQVALAPFKLFSTVIVTHQLSAPWFGLLALCIAVAVGMTWLMLYTDRRFDRALKDRQRDAYPPRATEGLESGVADRKPRWRQVAWLSGSGPIAWRQLVGANRQRSQLAVALALPAVLALLPVFVCRDGPKAAVQVAAALTFYSFLLLPTALKFDFRRDIQRMVILKTLPIRPAAVVVGQICAPTLLAFLFQATVLAATMIIRPFPFWMMIATLLLLGPLNALIFAIDNLMYLLYPYRLNQEGIEIFLRTTLTFTAKGLIFAMGLVLTLGWSMTARQIALQLPLGLRDPAMVFVIGGSFAPCAVTAGTIHLLARAYVRFDPSQDIPA